ncbi:sigma-70 family RNA polymerase sigma factor [Alienimonas sp. DA493]|uniref:sigma-70 family RNA polymerase sigma factor n=1 Tax=Alienimonas sp. DA493 TaxID=3373605 RepID=UPI0037550452
MDADAELDRHVRRVQAGDLDAYAEVVRGCERLVRGWVGVRCPPGGDADEVAQKAFVEAFRHIDDYEPGTDFRAWLMTIARYQLMAECTRLRRVADYHSRYAPLALADALARQVERDRLERASEHEAKLGHLQTCLGTLDDGARRLLAWRYRDELPLEQIADRTDRSVGAIKKNLHLLRKKLHECVRLKTAAEAMP